MKLFKKNISFCFLTILFCWTVAWGQCPEGNVALLTQAAVDNFAVLYPDCIEITSSLYIGHWDIDSDITDLSPLAQIISIGGGLRMYNNDSLFSLISLENLVSIGDFLTIGEHDNLTNLNGLENLTSIGGGLHIHGNGNLLNLISLGNLVSSEINGSLSISNNPMLGSLNGLENLTSFSFYVTITNNANLSSLSGLDNLTSIGDDALLGGDLEISDNPNLISLNGLESVNSIKHSLQIQNNDNLMNLNGLQSITYNSVEFLQIYNNPTLSVCHASGVCDYIQNGGLSEIYGNTTNCNSPEEILVLCTIPTTTPNDLPQITISPNPTNGTFALQGIPLGTYQILNTSGQIIRQGELKNNVSIDISDAAQGVYFISITIDNETVVKRIVKM